MEIAEVIERGSNDTLQALKNVSKKKLLAETAKVDKVLSKFKTQRLVNCSMQELLLLQID